MFNFDNTTEQITGKTVSTPDLIGNVNYQILHGGVSATVLDTLGGVIAMYEIFKRGQGTFDELTKKVMKVATVDLRIDYLAVGRGAFLYVHRRDYPHGAKGLYGTNDVGGRYRQADCTWHCQLCVLIKKTFVNLTNIFIFFKFFYFSLWSLFANCLALSTAFGVLFGVSSATSVFTPPPST